MGKTKNSMLSYVEALAVRRARVLAIFDLYNAQRFDEMLLHYEDEIAFTSPPLKDGEHDNDASGVGKSAMKARLELFWRKYGRLQVDEVFAVADQVSVIVIDAQGRRANFCIEVSPGEKVRRLLVFQSAQASAQAA